MRWFKRAAEHGQVDAIYNFAVGLEDGSFGSPNPKEAMQWFKKGADEGHAIAMYNYAVGLEDGSLLKIINKTLFRTIKRLPKKATLKQCLTMLSVLMIPHLKDRIPCTLR